MSERLIEMEMPEIFSPLFEPYRYKNFYGGRGGAKSWAFADALLLNGLQSEERILCAREIQNTIAESVLKLLEDRIDHFQLRDHYEVQKTTIIGANGTLFLFKGLRANVQEIKSMEGITKCWIEEAQAVSEESFKVLIPTIRREGSEIWLSWNVGEKKDPVYQRFVANMPPDCISVKVGWRDNPFFPETLNRERLYCLQVDKDAHDHIWEGKPLFISDALVFKNKFVVEDFETPKHISKFRFGGDWGFSNDPTALVRCYIVDRDLFIDYEAAGVGIEFEELPQLFELVPESRNHIIRADSARPETISYMKRKGFMIESCEKWNGSVKDGIEFLKSFQKIHIHSRCKRVKDEFEHYSFKKDRKTDEVLPILIDSFNHCFIGSTKIATNKGETNLSDIKVGDLVYTRGGYKKVRTVWENGHKQVFNYQFANGRELIGTVTHKVITENGKVELGNIGIRDRLFFLKREDQEWKFVKAKNTWKSYLMASLFDGIKMPKAGKAFLTCITMQKKKKKIKGFIGMFGKVIMERFQKDFASIIKMEIPLTTISPIWNACLETSTLQCIENNGIKNIKPKSPIILLTSGLLLQNGIKAMKAEGNILWLQSWAGKIFSQKNSFAIIAAKNIKDFKKGNSAPIIANQNIEVYQESMMWKKVVSFAKKHLRRINISKQLHAAVDAGQFSPIRIENVYDLEVEDCHEYFANGILVSNCIDALRYALQDEIKGVTDWDAVVNG